MSIDTYAELRKDFVKRAPPSAAEAAAPIRSLAPPPTNMAQANNARGEGKVTLNALQAIFLNRILNRNASNK